MKPGLLIIGEITPRMAEAFAASFSCYYLDQIADINQFLATDGPSVQAITTSGHDGVPDEILDRLTAVKIISNYGVGYDAIDVDKAVSKDIIVTHTPDVLNEEVATTALMLLMAVCRELLVNDRYIREGNWSKKGNTPRSRAVDGMAVGLLGYGRIGQAIAAKLEAFSCDVSYHARTERENSPHRYFPDLVSMAQDVTALIVITPGGASTHHLVTDEVMEALGPDGILVNVARGSVVDEDALVAALTDGRLGAAGLDVFAAAPHLPEVLFTMDNVVLTPHIGSATIETRQAMGDLTVENLVRYFSEGKVTTPVPECKHLVS